MARPSKKQLAARKAAQQLERRNARVSLLEVAYLVRPFAALADFAYVACEACGQEQLEAHDERGCVVCGHEIARTHALHGELKREAEGKLQALAA